MKMMTGALGALAFGMTMPAMAQVATPTPDQVQEQVDERQANQEDRIQAGVDNGDLTHHEAKKLDKQQLKIAHTKENMRADHDGRLTHHDRKDLHKKQVRASKSIHKAETDDDVQ